MCNVYALGQCEQFTLLFRFGENLRELFFLSFYFEKLSSNWKMHPGVTGIIKRANIVQKNEWKREKYFILPTFSALPFR